jgi:hypothetical protein
MSPTCAIRWKTSARRNYQWQACPSWLVIFRQPGANIILRSIACGSASSLKASIPAAIDLTVVLDQTTDDPGLVHDVEQTLLISIGLVILVVFIFLRNVRATFIPSVVVPVSLIGTFGVMYLCGYSLDNLSLMALTISTGFVVDDAIVVIENVTRHLEQGMRPMQAALKGAKKSASRYCRSVSRWLRCIHSDPADGWHRRALVPRIRRHALDCHSRFARRFADHHADDVRQAYSSTSARKITADLSGERKVLPGLRMLRAQPAGSCGTGDHARRSPAHDRRECLLLHSCLKDFFRSRITEHVWRHAGCRKIRPFRRCKAKPITRFKTLLELIRP